jgi:hypothetical protein
MTKAKSPSKPVTRQPIKRVEKTFKARSIGGTGEVRFHSHMHWIPEGHEDESEVLATCTPSVSFNPDCECGECGVMFVADKKMAANLRSIADLIDATPIHREQHQVTLGPQ